MKKFAALLLTLAAIFSFTACGKKKNKKTTTAPTTTSAVDPNNLIENGDFSTGEVQVADSGNKFIGKWWLYSMENGIGSLAINEQRQAVVTVDKMSNAMHCVQFAYDGFNISKKNKYKVEFDAKASYARKLEVRIQENGGVYENYMCEGDKNKVITVDLTTEMKHFELEFTSAVFDKAPRLAFNCGKFDGDPLQDGCVLTFDNVSVKCTYDAGEIQEDPLHRPKIKLNQLGFYKNQVKQAVFVGNAGGELDARFYIMDAETHQKAYEYTVYIKLVGTNSPSMEYVGIGDFSFFNTPGKYYLSTNYYCGDSDVFEIYDTNAPTVYDELLADSIMMLYKQRCGVVLAEDENDKFAHAACHQTAATIYGTNETKVVSGGWHDAGDYGKYVVPGAQTVENLLMTFEKSGAGVFTYPSYVTGTDSTIPDILEEAAWELDWMLLMQDQRTGTKGQVFHKVTTANFPGNEVSATADTAPLIISPASYNATADFAAVMAHASRVFAAYDSARAVAYADAAKLAYEALGKMSKTKFENPNGIFTGDYSDADLDDELAWAAIEMYLTDTTSSNRASYLSTFITNYTKTAEVGLGWANVNGFAVISYLKNVSSTDTNYASVKKYFLDYADSLFDIIYDEKAAKENDNHVGEQDVYNATVTSFVWGSNLAIANNGILLDYAMQFADVDNKAKYSELAQKQLNYLLGQNANYYCFVTGYGNLSPENPHHRPSMIAQEAMKGMLVGGPNADFANNGNDTIATQYCQGEAPAFCYIDHNNSWSTNEVTIYWNSPLTYLVAAVKYNLTQD